MNERVAEPQTFRHRSPGAVERKGLSSEVVGLKATPQRDHRAEGTHPERREPGGQGDGRQQHGGGDEARERVEARAPHHRTLLGELPAQGRQNQVAQRDPGQRGRCPAQDVRQGDGGDDPAGAIAECLERADGGGILRDCLGYEGPQDNDHDEQQDRSEGEE